MGTLADDLRLLRPVDPTNPSHYWKPLPGSGGGGGGADGKGRVPGAGNTIDSILGAQVCVDCVLCAELCCQLQTLAMRHPE